MKNVLVMGSGRSGTSMVTGTLAKAGYFMGENLWNARDANPKGFFEDLEINAINEEILAPLIPRRFYIQGIKRLHIPPRAFFRDRPIRGQRWLARIPLNTTIQSSTEIEARIQKIISNKPYCLKDPRFSYTLPVWRPFLQDTVYICVFRDPASTALSILKECASFRKLKHRVDGIKLNRQHALQIWTLMYQHILRKHSFQGDWLFLHYNQALTTEGLKSLEVFTRARVNYSFPNESIRRTFSDEPVPKQTLDIYNQLCNLANYSDR